MISRKYKWRSEQRNEKKNAKECEEEREGKNENQGMQKFAIKWRGMALYVWEVK